jgi:hypothetical protein
MRKAIASSLLAATIIILLFASAAYGEESALPMLVIDQDPKGTNVRDSPGGKIIKVIPFGGKTDPEIEARLVIVTGSQKDWFKVILSDKSSGWMHRSVLGSCASPTEDGDPHMRAEPSYSSRDLGIVKDRTPLALLDVKGLWGKFEITAPDGTSKSGWLRQEALFSNPHNDCRVKPNVSVAQAPHWKGKFQNKGKYLEITDFYESSAEEYYISFIFTENGQEIVSDNSPVKAQSLQSVRVSNYGPIVFTIQKGDKQIDVTPYKGPEEVEKADWADKCYGSYTRIK